MNIADIKPAVVTSDAGVVEGIFLSYESALAWAKEHRMNENNIRGGGVPFHDVTFPKNMPMPNIFHHAKDEELDGWRVTVDYSMPKGTLNVSPDIFSALHEFGQRQRSEHFMRDSLLYPNTSKMPQPREPFKTKDIQEMEKQK